MSVRVRYLDRDGNDQEEVKRGLATWKQFELHQREECVERAKELVARVGS